MTITASELRANFPAFKNPKTFPDSAINMWLGVAYSMLNAARWGATLDLGAQLYTCHNIALEARNTAEGANGVPPGVQVGPLNNKSVDKASAGYDTSGAINPDDGVWNLTNYGTRFVYYMRMFGAGPIQIGAGGGGGFDLSISPASGICDDQGAWQGPWPWNFPNPSNSG